MRAGAATAAVAAVLALLVATSAQAAPLGPEQAKLTAPSSGPFAALGPPTFGASVSLSADGNTALVGGYSDGHHNGGTGAAWVYTRSGSTWAVQSKLVAPVQGKDLELGKAEFGTSVALSSDGDTAIVGAPSDNHRAGAAWVFHRATGNWNERAKLTAPTTGALGTQGDPKPRFGSSVALSADGRTALIGAPSLHHFRGAVWVYTEASAGGWSARQRLAAPRTGPVRAVGDGFFGDSVALSAHAATALIGADGDNAAKGAAYLFTQVGAALKVRQKLTAPSSGPDKRIGSPGFGLSVALSASGRTALIGGPSDRPGGGNGFGAGAAWVFERGLSAWVEQHKLTAPIKRPGADVFGFAVSLSGDGATALVGVPDQGDDGAGWAFARRGHRWRAHEVLAPASGPDAAHPGANFGISAAISGDGSTVLIGGYGEQRAGAAWVFG